MQNTQAIVVCDNTLDAMKRLRAGNRGVPVQDIFGISENSWKKICKGQPIRRSVVSRLLDRLNTMQV